MSGWIESHEVVRLSLTKLSVCDFLRIKKYYTMQVEQTPAYAREYNPDPI